MQGESPIKPVWSLKDLRVLTSSMPNQENPILKPNRNKWWLFPLVRWLGESGIYHCVPNRKHPIGSKGRSCPGKFWSSTDMEPQATNKVRAQVTNPDIAGLPHIRYVGP